MHYQLTTTPRGEPRVAHIFDMRELHEFFDSVDLPLASDVGLICYDDTVTHGGGYIVSTYGPSDVLLLLMEDNTKAVAGIDSLRRYLVRTGQTFPEGLH